MKNERSKKKSRRLGGGEIWHTGRHGKSFPPAVCVFFLRAKLAFCAPGIYRRASTVCVNRGVKKLYPPQLPEDIPTHTVQCGKNLCNEQNIKNPLQYEKQHHIP
jgi:hypothetical protein